MMNRNGQRMIKIKRENISNKNETHISAVGDKSL